MEYPCNWCPFISQKSNGTHLRTCRGTNGIPFVPHKEYRANWLKLDIKEEDASLMHATPCTGPRGRKGHIPQTKLKLDLRSRILLNQYESCKRQLKRNSTVDNKRKVSRLKNKIAKAIKRAKENCIGGQLARLNPSDRYIMARIWRITRNLKRQPPSNYPLKIMTAASTENTSNRPTDVK